MKILIFNGAVRKNGDTAQLLQILTEQLQGHEIDTVYCDDKKISPCVDCRFCWKNPSCALKDGMQEIYRKIDDADWIILASPVHFDEISGSLMQVMSRLQMYCMARMMRKEELMQDRKRKGAAILVAGGPGKAEPAHRMMKVLLHTMHASDEVIIHCKGTDRKAVQENESIMDELKQLAGRINQGD